MSLAAFAQASTLATAERRTIPFDQQFHFKIFDDKNPQKSFVGQTLTSSVVVSIEAAFVTVSIGYGFVPLLPAITFGPADAAPSRPGDLTLGDTINSLASKLNEAAPFLPLDDLKKLKAARPVAPSNSPAGPQTAQALSFGIQLNPALTQRFLQVLQDNDEMGADELQELFQTVQPPPDKIQFLYALYDNGTGRAFQSEPLLNIAGLGIADGDRPFRHFATPILIAPRSTIQLDVIPQSDFRGDLYISLHGYKVLGGAGTPTGHKLGSNAPGRRMRRP